MRRGILRIGRWVTLAACGLAVAAGPGEQTAANPETAARPSLEIVSEAFDAGEVVRGATVEAEFTFRNSGDGVLEILRAKPG